jgi:hypothetical protein
MPAIAASLPRDTAVGAAVLTAHIAFLVATLFALVG